MSDLIAPGSTIQFTITKVPARLASQKTLQRLMRMQPVIRGGLKKLQERRRRHDNKTYVRAGKDWTNRAKATRLTRVAPGEQFTLTLTPQILADVRAIQDCVEMTAG
ncbi:MAG: hypothetical protein ACYTEV_06770 [Planctomycetota bacterium]|jgi:hypothetical protein